MESGEGFITVVSGLPRSGTSMMMQMLRAGGMPVLTDGVREADESNPRGYLEFEAVKGLARSQEWVSGAVGKAVKVVHALVPLLPEGFAYRVILMRRDLGEVVRSQRAMLGRLGRTGAELSDERLGAALAAQLEKTREWMAGRAGFRVLEVGYRECVEDPSGEAARVNAFVGGGLDEGRMAGAVEAGLWRERGN